MATRGLPGFLRRSRRSDFDETDEDEDEKEEEEEDTTEGDEQQSHNNNDKKTSDPTENGKSSKLPPKPNPNATTPREDSWGLLMGERYNAGEGSDETTKAKTTTFEETVEDYTENENDDDNNNKNGVNNAANKKTISHQDSQLSMASSLGMDESFQSRNMKVMERTYSYRESQFEKIMKADVVQMSELRKLGWNGIPPEHRAMAWKIMLGYLPTNASRRKQTLERKRAEYKETIRQHYDIPDDSRTIQEQETLRQVLVDVPRTAPEIPLFRNERIKRALGRLLYIWAMRHPASSYVQGINDLATPLFCVFLSDYYNGEDVQDGNVMVVISDERLEEVEADVYWCLTNILAGIQDHYTADQPGVQRMVMRLEELVRRIDTSLCEHFEEVGIQFMQFAFKWMNCLLLREFNLQCVIRLWDTYISEDQVGSSGGGFENFHVYVCAAFLCQFSQPLQEMGFDELFGFMQQVPTDDWGETEIEMLLSQAYVLSTLFGGSDAHLNNTTSSRLSM